MNAYSGIRRFYHAVVPRKLRESDFITRLKAKILGRAWVHYSIYNEEYYANLVEGPAARSAGTIARSIVDDLQPKSVIDVGCGTGALLAALRDAGCGVRGLEYAEAGIRYCHARGLNVTKFDLQRDTFKGRERFDVAISMEVAEHLPELCAERYLDLLCLLSPVLVMTAAAPGQGGADHLNEQPAGYWIGKLRQRGYKLDKPKTERWRQQWREAGNVQDWYYNNLMVFRRAQELHAR